MKNIPYGFVVACLCLFLAGCGKSADYHYELAMRHKESGADDRAIEEFQKAIKADPNFAGAHNQLGILYGKVGLYEKAVEHCRRAVDIDTDFASAYYNMGVLYYAHLNEPAKALTAYRRYLHLKPGGQRAEAVRKIVAALMTRPEVRSALAGSPPTRMELAKKRADAGEFEEAASIYEKLIVEKPRSSGRARVELAKIYEQKLDKPGKALEQYQAYLDTHINAPDAAEVMAAVGRLRGRVNISPAPKEVSRDTLKEAQELLSKKKISDAMAILERARSRSPESEEVHDLLAEAYLGAGDLKGAEKEYEWLRSRQEDFAYGKELAGIYSTLAGADLDRKNYEEAEERFRKALAIEPENASHRWGLARALAGQGRFEAALEETSSGRPAGGARVSDSRMAGLYLSYARHLSGRGRYEAAVESFKKAKALQPNIDLTTDMANIFEGRAGLERDNGRLAAAEKEYLEALRLDPGRNRIHRELALVYEKMGQYDKALAELEKVSKRGKGGAEAFREMARIHETYKADGAKALAFYRKYVEALPGAPDAAKVREKIRAAENEKKKIVEYEQAVKRKPSNSTTRYNLAVLLQRQGKLREAIEEYRKALVIEPDNAQAHFNLGYSYDRLKMYNEAIKEYRKAIQYKPDYIKAYNNMAAVYKAKGRFGKAIAAYKKALEIDPQYAQAHLGLAAIYADELKDTRKAKYYYQQYLRLQPEGTYAPQVRAWLRGMG